MPWLNGSLVRVTPALLEVGGQRLAHWFDGVAMLNRFGFADGKVSYASRFLESTAYADAKDGEWRHGGFATDPCRSIFKRVQQIFSPDITDNPNVNLARIGEATRHDATPSPSIRSRDARRSATSITPPLKLTLHGAPLNDMERNDS